MVRKADRDAGKCLCVAGQVPSSVVRSQAGRWCRPPAWSPEPRGLPSWAVTVSQRPGAGLPALERSLTVLPAFTSPGNPGRVLVRLSEAPLPFLVVIVVSSLAGSPRVN